MTFLDQGSIKKVLFGTNDPNAGGWGRVFPNAYKSLFLWHIGPLFVEDFRQIHGKSTKSLKLRGTQVPNLWGGSVHKFGSFVPNKIVFYGFPLAPIKLGTLPKA